VSRHQRSPAASAPERVSVHERRDRAASPFRGDRRQAGNRRIYRARDGPPMEADGTAAGQRHRRRGARRPDIRDASRPHAREVTIDDHVPEVVTSAHAIQWQRVRGPLPERASDRRITSILTSRCGLRGWTRRGPAVPCSSSQVIPRQWSESARERREWFVLHAELRSLE